MKKRETETSSTCGETSEHVIDDILETIAPSCQIKGISERKEASKWLSENFYPHVREVNELDTGYELIFEKPSKEFTAVILDVFRQEMECCPTFSLSLIVKPNKEKISYQYYGSKAIKNELKEAFEGIGLIK